MFPKVFKPDHKAAVQSHHFTTFHTSLKEEEVLKKIKEMGFSKFLSPDSTGGWGKQYKDNRINAAQFHYAQCCSGTKVAGQWIAAPISQKHLENVGLTPDDLVVWIKYLNGFRMGLRYLYFGQQDALVNTERDIPADSHWVLIPPSSSTSVSVTYFQWICLRYLINTTYPVGNAHTHPLCYYHIPRIAIMLHKEYGLTKWRAFLFAHMAGAVYAYYAVIPTADFAVQNYRWDLSVKASEFRQIMDACSGYPMNFMVALHGIQHYANKNIRTFIPPTYDFKLCRELFAKGDYEGFIKHIRDSYRSKTKTTKKRNVKEEVVG